MSSPNWRLPFLTASPQTLFLWKGIPRIALIALLLLACPVQAKTCGSITFNGKKTNISCSVAKPAKKNNTTPQNRSAPKKNTATASTIGSDAPPALLPVAATLPPAVPPLPYATTAPAAPVASGHCSAVITFNGKKHKIKHRCPLLPLRAGGIPLAVSEPSGDFKTRQEQYKQTVNELAAKYQVDPALIHAVISVESGYRSDAVSNKGAVGLMQLMPGTASDMNITDPYNPANNLEGGIKYLSLQLARFKDVELALAAYNAGPESLAHYNGQIPPYNETQHYVKRVMIYKDRYQNDWQQHIK
ncbi:MAG: lytic transglycosylase domain-containing protein [Cardiobacteriaceae bacterium]|nr:lytic transglycosylase domain-containing protein [Cardiobacteriaceae bacterium]